MILRRLATIAALVAAGYWLKKRIDLTSDEESIVKDSIEVDVPISVAYNQWTQFEEFPKFMKHVVEVRQLDDAHLHWRANVAGRTVEWDAEVTSQIPDRRVAWRSTSGTRNSGAVDFVPINDQRTRIMLTISYRPPGIAEKIGDALGLVRAEVRRDLHRFAGFIESRQSETGGWRGTVSEGKTVNGGDSGTGKTSGRIGARKDKAAMAGPSNAGN